MRTGPRRVVVMVWDGMRPDLISPELTPNLITLAARGVRLRNSHAVFPTVTRVNSASLSTGALPSGHGIVGNTLYAPLVDPSAPISIGDHRSLYRLIDSRGGRLLPVDTVADRVHTAGGRTVVVSTGSPGSAFLCHPRIRECGGDRLFNTAIMQPDGAEQELTDRFGQYPEDSVPNTAQNDYFCRAITEYVLPELNPDLLLYWHNDPDKTQHHRGFGSPEGLASIRDADTNLGMLVSWLRDQGQIEETVLAVVSDHGYASLEPNVEARAPFRAYGLGDEVERGGIILSRNGFSLLVNVPSGDAALIRRTAEACQAWPHGGAVFSGARGSLPVRGTLPLAAIGVDGDLAPDVLCALAWDDAPNSYGHRGRSAGVDSQYSANHGGISPWEIGNTFVLAGPGIQVGLEHTLPAANTDLAPTLLELLGLDFSTVPHGRVLREALIDGPPLDSIDVRQETVSADFGGFRQRVRFSLVGDTRYLDGGWAEREAGALIELR